MSAGLLASTTTPATAAPDESSTIPAIAAWASTAVGMTTSETANRNALIAVDLDNPPKAKTHEM